MRRQRQKLPPPIANADAFQDTFTRISTNEVMSVTISFHQRTIDRVAGLNTVGACMDPITSRNKRVLEAVQRYGSTKTYAQIAAMFGITTTHAVAITHAAGLRKTRFAPLDARVKEEEQRKLLEKCARTHTLKEVAAKLHVTQEWARQLYKKWGITRTPRSRTSLHYMSNRELRKIFTQPTRTLLQIAQELGVSWPAVVRELRKRGITPVTLYQRRRNLAEKGLRICSRCKKIKPLEEFQKKPSGYGSRCKPCGAAVAREWYQKKRQARASLTP